MAVLMQGVSRELFKTQSREKADMSKANGKFPNCFQPIQLFLSMPSCLPSFGSKSLRGEGGEGEWGESRVVESPQKSQVDTC